MSRLDRYVLWETSKPLVLALVVVLSALLMERLLRILDLLANQGGPLMLALKLIASLVPQYLGLALPAAFFLAVFLVIGKFAENSELDAMQGAGVSFARLLRPLIVVGVVLAAASLLLYGYVQPHARYAYKAIQHIVSNAAWNATLQEGVFVDSRGRLTLMAEEIDAVRGELGGVFVYREQGGGVALTTTARSAGLVGTGDGRHFLLRLQDGVQIRTGPSPGDVSSLTFESLDVELDLDVAIPPFRGRGAGEREMTLAELWRQRDEDGPTGQKIRAELNSRLARALSLALLPFVAAPFGVAAKRSRQAAGLAVAALVLLIYDDLLLLGASLAEDGRISAAVGLWLPFAGFALLGAVLFRRAARGLDSNPVTMALDGLDRIATTVARRWRREAAIP